MTICHITTGEISSTRKTSSIFKTLFFVFSWVKVLYDFVMNDNVGPWARVMRPTKFGKATGENSSQVDDGMKTLSKENYKQG